MTSYVRPAAAAGPYGCRVPVGPYGGPYTRVANPSLTAVETPEGD
ncbi:hypothetical protein [Streptomyces sp. R41]|uniref:Uncharacterized protein n=1 Tax=Streptomyces sp. R41 TaxID=3238632 RepID=A0AB39RGI7_9ACTN